MDRRRGSEPSRSIDWLPWGLSIFGACCAVFVLVRGVLPERSANRELLQRVVRLEADLGRVRQNAAEELARAKEQLTRQALAKQAEVDAAREQERVRAEREAARRDLSHVLGSEIRSGEVTLEERGGELVAVIRYELLFSGTSAIIEPRGRKMLRQLAMAIHRMPSSQTYRIGGRTEKQQRAIARFLEIAGRVPHERLTLAGVNAPPGGELPATVELAFVKPER